VRLISSFGAHLYTRERELQLLPRKCMHRLTDATMCIMCLTPGHRFTYARVT
jgi:hypothetical protein